jgi:hypothetical protein
MSRKDIGSTHNLSYEPAQLTSSSRFLSTQVNAECHGHPKASSKFLDRYRLLQIELSFDQVSVLSDVPAWQVCKSTDLTLRQIDYFWWILKESPVMREIWKLPRLKHLLNILISRGFP